LTQFSNPQKEQNARKKAEIELVEAHQRIAELQRQLEAITSSPTGTPPVPKFKLLPHSDLLELKRWNTPTIYNGWEQITKRNGSEEPVNLEETRDLMPQMGPMVGYAITLQVEPSNPKHRQTNPGAWAEYRRYVASIPGPKIVVVQDLDKPRVIGSFWGEVMSNTHRALGCVGTITDGAVRDVDEMTNAGFKALARRLCVGHAHVIPVKWGIAVEVFGRKIDPGQLIHADKHGFIVLQPDEMDRILEAARYMDSNECRTVIVAARSTSGLTSDQMIDQMDAAATKFGQNAKDYFSRRTTDKEGGEW